jgi:hypothetical protein
MSDNGPPSEHLGHDEDRVMTFPEWCAKNTLSLATGQRIVRRGEGPTITRLSERRIGITVRHNKEWQARRALPPTA